MTATNNVQVRYRHVELASDIPMHALGDGTFRLGLDAPPPVRTVLSIGASDGARAYAVVSVAEAANDRGARGCVVREVPPDQLPTTVGSERLGSGALGAAEGSPSAATPAAEAEDDADGYGAHMAVPAPVISEDSSEPHEIGDDAGNDGGSDSGNDEAASPEGGNGGDTAASRGKKRRGRQRR